ncbi:T9SS type B sorting domain-containing protein [Kordia sp. TARA_039_SRF]|nr:T9SS type B sorting domain-containing protein [Kordia sp. TARA_039_SRF]
MMPTDEFLLGDCDGDGVSNGDELFPPDGEDPTNPLDPCDLNVGDITLDPSQDWIDGDCDGDGIPNGPDGTHDDDGDGLPNFLDINNANSSDDIEIFNAVTPNGDGDNDVFTIRNILLYPDNQVRIYNRWGVLVYETKGYGQNGNFFTGVSDGRVTIQKNKLLPVGTYYYVVDYVANGVSKSKAGYLYIQR